jgi:hypothetical protein
MTPALPARAFQIDTGVPDLKASWDNTLKYSTAVRVEDHSDRLIAQGANPNNVNQDDGDRNFDRGFISQRLDLLSEFDADYKGFGLRVSGAAWYDLVYNQKNDNDSASTANSFSADHNEFTDDTRELHGRKAELLDAFVFGRADLGPTTLSARAGQHTLQWGESLFFAGNAIAGGMSPVDIVKALSVPNSQVKEILMPVPQVSAQLQLGESASIGAYYQLKWEKSRIPAAGSYFSDSDYLDEGGERLFVGPGVAFFRGDDVEAKDSGQGGVQFKVRPGAGVDLGFYAIRYHDKFPQLYVRPGMGPAGPIDPSVVDLSKGKVGEYFLVYPENIQAYGVSATRTFGDWNLATEVSMRRHAPLSSNGGVVLPGMDPDVDHDKNPQYAMGRTVHANFNWLAVFGPTFLSKESSFLGEVAWNKVTSIEVDNLQPRAEMSGWGFRTVYEPTYRQVLDGVDVSIPLGFGYCPKGKSAAGPVFGPDKGGDLSAGLNVSYLDAWRFALSYTHYYGPSDGFLTTDADGTTGRSYKQTLADRDFVAFSVRRTF